jgi:PAS domain S-box-containing protein
LRGYTPEEVKKQTFSEMISPNSLDLVINLYKSIFDVNSSKSINENTLYYIEQPHKNGGTVWIEVSTKLIKDEQGNIVEIQGVSRDITLRKKAEDELKVIFEELRLSKEKIETSLKQKNLLIEELKLSKEIMENVIAEKDKFFSIIAHDLKSPFSSFLGMTKMLAEGITELSVNEMKKQLTELSDLAELLQKLLENLLEWSRVKRGLFNYNPDSFILYNLVENITDLKGFKAKEKSIEIVNIVPKDLVVYADLNMLNTVLRNLISNALKFSHRGSKIIISSTFKSENLIEFKIQDFGVGMTEEVLNKLFSIKEKISSKGTENEPGTGLGLLLCKEFVEMHGSNFNVETKLGFGTSFYFDLQIVRS